MVEKLAGIGIHITWPPKDGVLPPPTHPFDTLSQPQQGSRASQVHMLIPDTNAFTPVLHGCGACRRES